MALTDEQIARLISDVTSGYAGGTITKAPIASVDDGVFDNMNDAVDAAQRAQKALISLSLEKRAEIIAAMRKAARENAASLGEMAHSETGYGNAADKTVKNLLAANKTPGLEDLRPMTYTGDYGLTLVEPAPFGVIGSITPSTNPTATVINNALSMVTAGNAVVFNTHPAAKRVSCEAVRLLNAAIASAGGPRNVLCTVAEPTLDSSKELMAHKKIALLAVTGGEAVVGVAMKSGKKCIAAGPGNPPVVVDDTANLKKAAEDIIKGAGFDNCILCIAEKEILAFDAIADRLLAQLGEAGAYVASATELEKILAVTVIKNEDGSFSPNKKFIGKPANVILRAAGIMPDRGYKIITGETAFAHPFVGTEMLMPVLPLARVRNLDDAIEKALIAEHGYHHTAMMHSENVHSLTAMARAVDTTIFVKNAPSYAGLGMSGEGYATLTIATPTGEGLTSAKNFTRSRRCTLYGSFRII